LSNDVSLQLQHLHSHYDKIYRVDADIPHGIFLLSEQLIKETSPCTPHDDALRLSHIRGEPSCGGEGTHDVSTLRYYSVRRLRRLRHFHLPDTISPPHIVDSLNCCHLDPLWYPRSGRYMSMVFDPVFLLVICETTIY
jgi:hypothetical protein